MALNARQEAFVQEYLIDLNATQAAVRAGYRGDPNTIGPRLLANVSVRSAVEAAMKEREARTHITQDRVLQELARIAFSDLRKAYHSDGTLKLPHEWDDDTAASMAGLETLTSGAGGEDSPAVLTTKKVKVFDKGAALTLAMRHLGMMNDKLTVDATVTGSVAYKANMPARGG